MKNQNNKLFNETTFYPALIKDMIQAEKEVIIYSPFISKYRADFLRKTLLKLKAKNIRVFIFTRPVNEHEAYMREEIRSVIEDYVKIGVDVICLEGFVHEKVAVIDRKIVWQGSLNILSQKSSKEMMMRIADEDFAEQVISNLKLNRKLATKYQPIDSVHNLNLSFRIFFLEPILSAVKWSLFSIYRVMIVLLRCILIIFNIIDAIFNKGKL
ncbi:hypothetical protein COY62_02190 [bacterium (Candidatus Howlettbacteria) CG_4_10_14_0_8_um_filter_40_9]|nr:MAG: hypothetical protein COY62_02190 [bacterium (Candidatus Howlettbacteria) CG_4_10_14_0_8_um_filter_40_9]